MAALALIAVFTNQTTIPIILSARSRTLQILQKENPLMKHPQFILLRGLVSVTYKISSTSVGETQYGVYLRLICLDSDCQPPSKVK